MKRLIILFLVLLLIACENVADSSHIKTVEVVKAIEEQGLDLTETKGERMVFTEKLGKKKPSTYKLDDHFISIYEFDTTEDREQAEKQFDEKTASMNLAPFKSFQQRNILIFVLVGEGEMPIDELFAALESLQEG